MFGGKAKELAGQLAEKERLLAEKEQRQQELEQEIAALKSRLKAAVDRLGDLQTREAGIVSALAEADAVRRNKIAEAESQARQVSEQAKAALESAGTEAGQIRDRAQQEADALLAQAKEEADKLIADAKADAQAMLKQAEFNMVEYKNNAERLNARLLQAAAQAKAQMRALDDAIQGIQFRQDDAHAEAAEVQSLIAGLDAAPVETPAAYHNPAALMQNIYAIEGRDIPDLAGQAAAPAENADAPAAEETSAENADEPAEEEAPAENADEPVQEETPAENVAPAEEETPAENADAPAEEEAPAENAAPAEKAEEPQEEERVWTVDDIVNSVLEESETGLGAAADLDKLIEEILK